MPPSGWILSSLFPWTLSFWESCWKQSLQKYSSQGTAFEQPGFSFCRDDGTQWDLPSLYVKIHIYIQLYGGEDDKISLYINVKMFQDGVWGSLGWWKVSLPVPGDGTG